jgi:hypothetical protein
MLFIEFLVVFLQKKISLAADMENCLDTFRSYIKSLSEKLKMEGLDLDENNDCYFSFEDKFFVKCSIDVEKEQFSLLAYIGSLPEDKACYYRGILESCYFWGDTAGANISLDPADGTLLLTQYGDMNISNSDTFYNALEKFVNAMEHWESKRLAEWMAMNDDDGEVVGSPMAGPGMPGMRRFGA